MEHRKRGNLQFLCSAFLFFFFLKRDESLAMLPRVDVTPRLPKQPGLHARHHSWLRYSLGFSFIWQLAKATSDGTTGLW